MLRWWIFSNQYDFYSARY
jgi:hypothetical protein